jgi:hypothetical protein
LSKEENYGVIDITQKEQRGSCVTTSMYLPKNQSRQRTGLSFPDKKSLKINPPPLKNLKRTCAMDQNSTMANSMITELKVLWTLKNEGLSSPE